MRAQMKLSDAIRDSIETSNTRYSSSVRILECESRKTGNGEMYPQQTFVFQTSKGCLGNKTIHRRKSIA